MSEQFNPEEIKVIREAKAMLERVLKDADAYVFADFIISKGMIEKTELGHDSGMRDNMVVAGGVISSLLRQEPPNDIDVFILQSDFRTFNAMTMIKSGTWSFRNNFDGESVRSEYANKHVLATATNLDTKIQYILTDFKDRKDMLLDFDYLHCTASYHKSQLFLNRETFDAIQKKQLVWQHKDKEPAQWRTEKFLSRGWTSVEDAMLESVPTTDDILARNLNTIMKKKPLWDKTLEEDGFEEAFEILSRP